MAVHFKEIVFHNGNGIDIQLTIEAPIGSVIVSNHPVAAHSTYKVMPGVNDCPAVLFVAVAVGHGKDRETFSVSGNPTPAFLTNVDAQYVIGSIDGAICGATERGQG